MGVNIRDIMGFSGGSAGKESVCSAGDPISIPGSGRSAEKGQAAYSSILGFPWWLSSKESTCNAGDQKTLVQSLGWEDLLEEEIATHSCILAW